MKFSVLKPFKYFISSVFTLVTSVTENFELSNHSFFFKISSVVLGGVAKIKIASSSFFTSSTECMASWACLFLIALFIESRFESMTYTLKLSLERPFAIEPPIRPIPQITISFIIFL